jgi:two-component system response regulator
MDDAPLILLVDDDSNDLELARLALERAQIPHRLQMVRDGVAALDWLFRRGRFAGREQEPSPRLILLDLKLPKVNGLEVLEQIRGDERTKTVPVVIFTSSLEEKDLAESYRRGANAYLRKPVDFHEYKELIADAGSFWIRRNQTPGEEGPPT